jgi:hypothetical protein
MYLYFYCINKNIKYYFKSQNSSQEAKKNGLFETFYKIKKKKNF